MDPNGTGEDPRKCSPSGVVERLPKLHGFILQLSHTKNHFTMDTHDHCS